MRKNDGGQSAPMLDAARQLGLDALLFLVQDDARISHFLNVSGIDAADLRTSAREDRTLAAVLEHLLAHESLLLVFAAHGDHRPNDVQPALDRLRREGEMA